MKATPTEISQVLVLEPMVFADDRGFFFGSFNERVFNEVTGLDAAFVQDNHSKSGRNGLRGLHYQIQHPQGKLVRVTQGAVFDVAVDIRKGSPTFGKYVGIELFAENKNSPEYERCIAWNDSDTGIEWHLQGTPVLPARDQRGGAPNNDQNIRKDRFRSWPKI